ncbi:MAG TPA: alanine--tRNA ligase [Gaiellaceae bacterium]|jgi:alanyl-tRNA synthetase|nr:alanine--tRNA ligase [Gaiellaceae bacterium]
MAMTTNELREAFQTFYEERGHLRVPGHSLIPPAEDQSTLFIIAGMQPFKPYFLRTKEPPAKRVVSVQPCLRAGGKDNDLDEVGRTDRHCSFFEMMGNFSFGDYYKDDAVDFAWDWVTGVLQLDPERLWATVHEGDPALELGEDEVAIAAWQRKGIPPERIVRLGKDNFWQSGETGPCGQCTEIFFDRGEKYACGDPDCGPGHCDRIMEIYNLVFMAYDLQPGNVLVPLPTPNVDTGNGIERTACVLQDVSSVFDTDGFQLIMQWVERESGVAYNDSEVSQRAHRVLADHGRAVSFLIAEGVEPSNEGRGYICRRLLRRAIYQAKRIGLEGLHRLPAVVIEQMGDAYPALREHAADIERIVRAEEEKFSETLARGMKVFDDLAGKEAITAEDAFTLVATYGFPIELAQELAEERGQAIDIDGFLGQMDQHREISRGGGESSTQQTAAQLVGPGHPETEFVGYSKTRVLTAVVDAAPPDGTRQFVKLEQSPFYAASGGQVSDHGYLALEGEDVRLDVADVLKFGDDQVLVVDLAGHPPVALNTRVEAVVNWSDRFPTQANHTATHLLHQALRDVLGDHVKQAGSAVRPDKLRFDFTHEKQLTPEERERVERIVNEKVFEAIPVRTFVTPIEEARKLGAMMLFGEKYGAEVRVVEIGDYSTELCGGTHVRSTAEIGPFVILSEGSVGSGARRIEAVTAGEGWTVLEGRSKELEAVRAEVEQLKRESKKPKASAGRGPEIVWQDKQGNVFVGEVTGANGSGLRDFSDQVRQREDVLAVVLASADDGKVALVVNLDKSLADLDAVAIVRELGPIIGGGGGGRPNLAEAGGKNVGAVRDALQAGRDKLTAALN